MPVQRTNKELVALLDTYFARRSAHVVFVEEYASGSNGGTFTAGAWQKRTLNYFLVNTSGDLGMGMTFWGLAVNPGIYEIHAECPAYSVNRHQARIQDITNNVQLLLGTSAYAPAGVQSSSIIVGRIYCNVPFYIELQHYCETTKVSSGLGLGCGLDAQNERYAFIDVHKVQ